MNYQDMASFYQFYQHNLSAAELTLRECIKIYDQSNNNLDIMGKYTTLLRLAHVLLSGKQYKQALEVVEQAIAVNPTSGVALLIAGMTMMIATDNYE